MWTETHYYRFPDQATAEAIAVQELAAIDVVGVISISETTTDGEGEVVTVQELPGYHVNARWWGIEPEAWEAYRIPAPNNPVRVFA
jgi:hypothetical protein